MSKSIFAATFVAAATVHPSIGLAEAGIEHVRPTISRDVPDVLGKPLFAFEATYPPGGLKALGGAYGYVRQRGLDAVLVERIDMHISHINGCPHRVVLHHGDAIKHRIPAARTAMLPVRHEALDLFGPRKHAALVGAETVTRVSNTHVSNDAFSHRRRVR